MKTNQKALSIKTHIKAGGLSAVQHTLKQLTIKTHIKAGGLSAVQHTLKQLAAR